MSGGKDSTATLLLALHRVPSESLIPIFCDTGNEHEITYRYLEEVERHLGIQIHRLKPDFSREIAVKRSFIAQDLRTRREYQRVPLLDDQGQIVPARDNQGRIQYRTVRRKGVEVREIIPRMVKRHGRRVRWSNKAKRRALAALHPTGNPFLDLCLWKGRFPSRKAQFCTEELKRNMAVAFQLDLIDQGYSVISWQGIRRDESENRRNAKQIERIGPRLWAFRPLVDWTAQQTVDFVRDQGCPLNPLYTMGCNRVGCMPCINVSKSELASVSYRFAEEIDRIEEWESLVSQCSKRGYSTMMADTHDAKDRREIFADLNIRARVRWATGDNGSLSLFAEGELSVPACASAYGLCE
jgi:3'-phosphoadenosine 5'-phosphosulfate sulfotransferase (PAPS reductase)/FAD synthetase